MANRKQTQQHIWDSLSHNVVRALSLSLTFMHILWLIVLCFYGIHNVQLCVCVASICVPWVFSWSLSLIWLFCPSSICFVFVLFYCILFYWFFFSDACLFSKEGKKGCGSRSEERWKGIGESRGKENQNRNIVYEKKSTFNFKNINTQKEKFLKCEQSK